MKQSPQVYSPERSWSSGKGVVQNCQDYQERTQSILICDPLHPNHKSTLKIMVSRSLLTSPVYAHGVPREQLQGMIFPNKITSIYLAGK